MATGVEIRNRRKAGGDAQLNEIWHAHSDCNVSGFSQDTSVGTVDEDGETCLWHERIRDAPEGAALSKAVSEGGPFPNRVDVVLIGKFVSIEKSVVLRASARTVAVAGSSSVR